MYESTRVKTLSFLYGEKWVDGPAAPANVVTAMPPAKANSEHTIMVVRRFFRIIASQYDAGAAPGRAAPVRVAPETAGATSRRCRPGRQPRPGCPRRPGAGRPTGRREPYGSGPRARSRPPGPGRRAAR